jgi:AraC-like DNA-binding protein
MLASTVRELTDPQEYRQAIRPARAEYVVTGRGRFLASVIRIDLHRLWMQRLHENLPRVWCIETQRIGLWFSAAPGFPARANGIELQDCKIGLVQPSRTLWHTLSGPAHLASMSLPVESLSETSVAMVGRDLTPRPDVLSMSAPSPAMARLQKLHAAVGEVAKAAPEIIANHTAARGIEHSLIEAVLTCMSGVCTREDTASRRRHARIIKRLREMVEEGPSEALYLTEVCKAAGVPLRTLNLCCNEFLGMSPKRYLTLRRLHLARKALLAASASAATVTEIAMRYGFWELGRFAVAYKSLFGESPSVTLHRMHE